MSRKAKGIAAKVPKVPGAFGAFPTPKKVAMIAQILSTNGGSRTSLIVSKKVGFDAPQYQTKAENFAPGKQTFRFDDFENLPAISNPAEARAENLNRRPEKPKNFGFESWESDKFHTAEET